MVISGRFIVHAPVQQLVQEHEYSLYQDKMAVDEVGNARIEYVGKYQSCMVFAGDCGRAQAHAHTRGDPAL